MVKNLPHPSLEELAVRAKTAAEQAKDDSLSREQRQQALLEKQIVLTELMSALTEQIKIELPKPTSTDASVYIYEETLQDVLLYICKNMDRYNPERGSFMNWFFFIFKRRKINAFHWLNWRGNVTSIYKEDDDEVEKNILDVYCLPDVSNPLRTEELIDFIKEDPEGLLVSTLFNNNLKASFQVILLKRCEENKAWKEIVQELELKTTHGPISTFYRRCCEKFASYFKKYLGE